MSYVAVGRLSGEERPTLMAQAVAILEKLDAEDQLTPKQRDLLQTWRSELTPPGEEPADIGLETRPGDL
jgi:hypothetical protein